MGITDCFCVIEGGEDKNRHLSSSLRDTGARDSLVGTTVANDGEKNAETFPQLWASYQDLVYRDLGCRRC